MIVDAIFGLFRTIVDALFSQLPNIEPPDVSGAVASIEPVWVYAGWANKYVPLVEAAAMFALLATVQMVLFVINLVSWIGKKIHLFG